jgi:uncharacterized membrane protein YoaK (UPF0700 family)
LAAHVTGNLVTLGASLVLGTSGVAAKLMALPTFCLGVITARLIGSANLTAKAHTVRFSSVG